MTISEQRSPADLSEAITDTLRASPAGLDVEQIITSVQHSLGPDTSASRIRAHLRHNTPNVFLRLNRDRYLLAAFTSGLGFQAEATYPTETYDLATLVHADCLDWLRQRSPASIHAIVTDPPYGLVEYSTKDQAKLRKGKGGVWRLPPAFDGARRSPLPRFTVLSATERSNLATFFSQWANAIAPILVPGANVVIATNPLLSYIVATALAKAGLERRGEIVRLVTTMRGGDRPKGAHLEFPDVSVMPRSMWEPWLVFRKPLEGRAQDNLRKWRTGGFRRPSENRPFGDVIRSAPTRKGERLLAPHPTLKPQGFLRPLVRAVLPLGKGIVLDPFCGAGSTLAAATSVGYTSIGIEKDETYFNLARNAIPKLTAYVPNSAGPRVRR